MMTPAPLMTGRSVGDSDVRSRGSRRSSIQTGTRVRSININRPGGKTRTQGTSFLPECAHGRIVSVLRLETAHAITLA